MATARVTSRATSSPTSPETKDALPVEGDAQQRPMLNGLKAVLSEAAVLAIIDVKGAIAEIGAEGRSQTLGHETVDADSLPGKLAAGAEAADIAFEPQVLARRNLVTHAKTDHGIDPFEVAGLGDGDLARTVEVEAEALEIDVKRAGQVEREADVLIPVAGAADDIDSGEARGRVLPARHFIGDARLDDRRLVVELGVTFDTHDHLRKPGEGAAAHVDAAGKTEIHPDEIGEQRELALAGLEIAHPGQKRVALLHDLEEAVIDIDLLTGRGDVAIDVDHPGIGGEAELPFVGRRRRFGVTEIGRERGARDPKPGADR